MFMGRKPVQFGLRPEARPVDPVLVRDVLDLGGRKRPLVEFVVLHLVECGLLIEVPHHVDTVEIAWPLRPGPARQ